MSGKKTTLTYRIIRKTIEICYPKTEIAGTEHLPEEPVIILLPL